MSEIKSLCSRIKTVGMSKIHICSLWEDPQKIAAKITYQRKSRRNQHHKISTRTLSPIVASLFSCCSQLSRLVAGSRAGTRSNAQYCTQQHGRCMKKRERSLFSSNINPRRSTRFPSETLIFISRSGGSIIDYRREDGCFPAFASCVTISNYDSPSSSETGLNPGI